MKRLSGPRRARPRSSDASAAQIWLGAKAAPPRPTCATWASTSTWRRSSTSAGAARSRRGPSARTPRIPPRMSAMAGGLRQGTPGTRGGGDPEALPGAGHGLPGRGRGGADRAPTRSRPCGASTSPPSSAGARAGVKLVMTSTAIYPALSPRPAMLSPRVSTAELRGQAGFQGVSITDDISVQALRRFGRSRPTARGRQAGNDLLLYCGGYADGAGSADALVRDARAGRLSTSATRASVRRILALRAKLARCDPRLDDAWPVQGPDGLASRPAPASRAARSRRSRAERGPRTVDSDSVASPQGRVPHAQRRGGMPTAATPTGPWKGGRDVDVAARPARRRRRLGGLRDSAVRADARHTSASAAPTPSARLRVRHTPIATEHLDPRPHRGKRLGAVDGLFARLDSRRRQRPRPPRLVDGPARRRRCAKQRRARPPRARRQPLQRRRPGRPSPSSSEKLHRHRLGRLGDTVSGTPPRQALTGGTESSGSSTSRAATGRASRRPRRSHSAMFTAATACGREGSPRSSSARTAASETPS